jgi:hypothetical protein
VAVAKKKAAKKKAAKKSARSVRVVRAAAVAESGGVKRSNVRDRYRRPQTAAVSE